MYDARVIGERIRKERIAYMKKQNRKSKSQEEFIETANLCHIKDNKETEKKLDRDTLSRWESGLSFPSLYWLDRLCDIFDCDLGYLLGEYPEKHRITAEVCEVTGLSEECVEELIKDKKRIKANYGAKGVLSQLLSAIGENRNRGFIKCLDELLFYKRECREFDKEKGHQEIEKTYEEAQAFGEFFNTEKRRELFLNHIEKKGSRFDIESKIGGAKFLKAIKGKKLGIVYKEEAKEKDDIDITEDDVLEFVPLKKEVEDSLWDMDNRIIENVTGVLIFRKGEYYDLLSKRKSNYEEQEEYILCELFKRILRELY